MDKFYSSFTFMLGFMVSVLVFNMAFGSKATEWFLLLVLLSMLVTNADKVSKAFGAKN